MWSCKIIFTSHILLPFLVICYIYSQQHCDGFHSYSPLLSSALYCADHFPLFLTIEQLNIYIHLSVLTSLHCPHSPVCDLCPTLLFPLCSPSIFLFQSPHCPFNMWLMSYFVLHPYSSLPVSYCADFVLFLFSAHISFPLSGPLAFWAAAQRADVL